MTTTTTRAGPATSRGLRAACAAAWSLPCGQCATPAGQPCVTDAGRGGYHLARFARARAAGLITAEAMAAALMAAGPVFTPATLVAGGAS